MTFRKSLTTAVAPAALIAASFGMAAPAQAGGDAYIGEIVSYGFNFCPRNWAAANGQLLSIAQNTALFSLLGTTYGGNGQTTFALPDLRGRVALGPGSAPGLGTYSLGEVLGAESFNVLTTNMPSHTHTAALRASRNVGDTTSPVDNSLARVSGVTAYSTVDPSANGNAGDVVVSATGSGTPVSKTSPRLAMNYCVALFGIFPPRN